MEFCPNAALWLTTATYSQCLTGGTCVRPIALHLNQRNSKYTKNKIQATSDTNISPINKDHSAFPRRLSWGCFTDKDLEHRPPSYVHFIAMR